MNQPKPFLHSFKIMALCLVMLAGNRSYGQADSIQYNSTCSNYRIQFNSTIFQRISFPESESWNFGDPSSGIYNTAGIQFPLHQYSSPGVYLVTLKVVLSGDTTTVQDSIRIISPIPYNFGPDIFLCTGADTTLNGPVIAGANYLWNDDSLTTTPFLKVTKTGVYTVEINGCAVADSIGVYYSNTPDPNLGSDHVLCAGEILTLNASSQNAVYTWKLNGTILADSVGQLSVVAPGGQYIVSLNVPGCGTYADTANITFSSLPAPPFSLGPDTLLCPNQVYTLNGVVPGSTAYNWSTGESGSTIQVTLPGVYWAFVTISNECQVVDSVQVTYRGDQALNFKDTAICQGSTLLLNADFGEGTYNWVSDPPQRNDQNQTGQSTYYVYEPGFYKITASVGSCVYKDSLHVSFNDSLILDIGRDTTLCIDEQYVLHAKGNANSYNWQNGDTSASEAVTMAGTYTVIAKNGCNTDTASVKITLHHCSCELILPNAFTPNGDGNNDVFMPLHPCSMSNFTLTIFNRYGQRVFQSADPSKYWDGRFNGANADMGVYVWMASYINTDTQKRYSNKGTVVLIR